MPFDLVLRCLKCEKLIVVPRAAYGYSGAYNAVLCPRCQNGFAHSHPFLDMFIWHTCIEDLEGWKFVRAEFEGPLLNTSLYFPELPPDFEEYDLKAVLYRCPRCETNKRITLAEMKLAGRYPARRVLVCGNCGLKRPGELKKHRELFLIYLKFNDWMADLGDWFSVYPAWVCDMFPQQFYEGLTGKKGGIAEVGGLPAKGKSEDDRR